MRKYKKLEVQMNRRVFISGALTGVSNPKSVKKKYERLGHLCEELGWEPYLPCRHTDPLMHPDASAGKVYQRNESHLSAASLLIAYVGIPSLGTGQEIQIAQAYGIPVVLLYERGSPVSRMTRGSPNVLVEIAFDSFDEALEEVRKLLLEIERCGVSMRHLGAEIRSWYFATAPSKLTEVRE